MDALALTDSAAFFLRQDKAQWSKLKDYLVSIPGHEKRRRVFLQELNGTRVNSTHPPTYLRRALLVARPQLPGTIQVDEAEWLSLDVELSRPKGAAAAKTG
jgi:hypothetical protein